METWEDLKFWDSSRWTVIQDRLTGLDRIGKLYCPQRQNLFKALDVVEFKNVRVAIVGQDPYPNRHHATGVAFAVPSDVDPLPPTLSNILKEYLTDLGHPIPRNPDLLKWCEQGVLLWNAIPSCSINIPLSHGWLEWTFLTSEIITELSKRGVVFAFLGATAREYKKFVSPNSKYIETSHPSPRGSLNSKTPFIGSRLFSTINDRLCQLKKEPVDWRL